MQHPGTLAGNVGDGLSRGVQGNQPDTAAGGKLQDRRVQPRIEAPAAEIFGFRQQPVQITVAERVAIEGALERLLKGLHGNRHGSARGRQLTQNFDLVEMMFVAIMGFADEHQPAWSQPGEQLRVAVERAVTAAKCRRHPARRRRRSRTGAQDTRRHHRQQQRGNQHACGESGPRQAR